MLTVISQGNHCRNQNCQKGDLNHSWVFGKDNLQQYPESD